MVGSPRTPTVLMVAHGFPPAGGSGSNRALAFARYLPAFGWRPLVLTPDARWAMNRNDRLLMYVPRSLAVVRTRSFEPAPRAGPSDAAASPTGRGEPGVLKRQLGHLKRFPDAHIGWLPFAVAAARNHDFDVMYSSSGPFTSHLVGFVLRRLTGKPWVVELRDGWYRWNRAIFPDYPVWRGPLEQRLEAAIIHAAKRVLLVTERMADAFRRQYADLPAEHFAVVPNGFDPAFGAKPVEHRADAEFEILHAGALYYGRSLAAFLEGAAALARAEPEFSRALRITLLGTLDAAARDELKHHALGERIRVVGYRDHATTLEAMRSADLLLLVANTTPGAEATVPGKLFEYLAVGRPVLAVAPRDSASADVLAETRGGWLAPAGEAAAIAQALRTAYCSHRAGLLTAPDATALERYDRRRLTRQLTCVFDDVVSARRF